MNDFSFRLNPYTFVRKYPEYLYLENQVSHMRAMLPINEFEWFSSVNHGLTYRFGQLCDDCVPKRQEAAKTLRQLNEAWIVDIEDEPDFSERKFSYANKDKAERRFANIPTIGNAVSDSKPYLHNLQIELTDACNERCIHCYLPNAKKDKCRALSKEQVINILHQYREMEGLKIVFSGGEILLHPHLFHILEECRRLNLMILLQSNLVSLTEMEIQKIKDLGVFNVQVSLYSTDEHIHETITHRKGSFAKTKRNLELLVKHDIPAMISCPVMEANYPTVRNLHRYAKEMGLDIYIDFMMMAGCDGCNDNLATRLNVEQVKEMLKFQLEVNPMFVDAISSSRTLEEALSKKYARRKTMCDILSASLCIDSDGTVYPCPGWNGMKLGNIKSITLSEAWNGETANQLRRISINGFPKCKGCDKQNFCDMCAVYNYNENGDLYDICPRFCEMAGILRDCVIEKYDELH